MLRRILFLAVLIGSTLVAIPSAPAAATYGCPGNRDSWREYRDSAGVVAAALQTYKTADGVCVSLVAKNKYAGRSKFMSLKLCNTARQQCTAVDEGMFKEYAGPIYYSARCVYALSRMNDGQGGVIIDGHWNSAGACN
ncbi:MULTISPECIES: hypothetical protein [unclassified Nocardioides]|uniref:hypothetical protein n=1 Tax=unclassified Nocardioides TaxID=2615069 RepID=UPI0030154B5B